MPSQVRQCDSTGRPHRRSVSSVAACVAGLAGPVLLQESMEIASHYQCNGTPMGYLIDAQGRIASELAIGAPALLALAAAGTDGALGVGGVEALGADPSTPNASTPNACLHSHYTRNPPNLRCSSLQTVSPR